MSTHLQLEQLSLLLSRLRRHQAKLASVQNFALGQLLQHQLTFPACQVSAGGLSLGAGATLGQGCDTRPCSLVPTLWSVLAGWLAPSFPACLLLDAVARCCSSGGAPCPAREEAACGGRDLNCGFSGCE